MTPSSAARQLMFAEAKPGGSKDELEIIEFGKKHRECNIRILAG